MTRVLLPSLLVLTLAACATATSTRSQVPAIWGGLTSGEHAVGFRSWTLRTDPHLLQLSVWYPSERSGAPLTYRDYLLLNLTETKLDPPTKPEQAKAAAAAEEFLTSAGLPAASAKSLVSAPVYARRDARALPSRRFPLVLVVQGNGQSASGQAVLSEFLASHGYIVATIPSITRITGQMTAVKDIQEKAEEEAVDIDRAVTALAEWPNVVKGPVSLVAHSFGARGALFYAMNHVTNAFVSLEGGIGTATGSEKMLGSKMLDLRAAIPPVLHFYELNDDRIVPDFRMLHSLRTPDLQLVRMNSMRHIHFSSDGFAAAMIPEMATLTKAGPDLKSDVVSVANQTLAFLDRQWASIRPAP